MKKYFAVITVMLISVVFVSCSNSVNNSQLYSLIADNDVTGVVDLYTKHYNEADSNTKFCNELLQYEEKVYDDYNNNKITYDEGRDIYKTIIEIAERLSLDDRFTVAYERFKALKTSKDNFEKGLEKLEKLRQGEYGSEKERVNEAAISCIDKFKMVSEDDSNYSEAKKLKEKASDYYKYYAAEVPDGLGVNK